MFFVNTYEKNVKLLYDQYDGLVKKKEEAASTAPSARRRLEELKLVRKRVGETMLLMDRMIYFVSSPDDLRKIKDACEEQEQEWIRSLSGMERRHLEAAEIAVTAEETQEEREGRADIFTDRYDFTDIPKVYQRAVSLAYYALLHYTKVKIRYWKS